MIEAICTGFRIPAGGFQSAIAVPLVLGGGLRAIGPFVTIAHALPVSLGPATLPPEDDVRPHPHIGIAALSYLFDGLMTHRDTLGVTQTIRPLEVNLMIAGRGVVHSERYEDLRRDGGTMHGLQIWIALPENHEDEEPSFAHFAVSEIPTFEADGVRGRLIAGIVDELVSPVRVRSPLYLQDIRLDAGARFAVPDAQGDRAAYLISGALECDGRSVVAGQTLVFKRGGDAAVTAVSPSHVLSFGGAPVGKRYLWWNLVGSSMDRLEAAKAKWREGGFGLPLGEHEFSPLPADRERPLLEVNA